MFGFKASVLITLLQLLSNTAAHGKKRHCLRDADATSLSNRWLAMNAALDVTAAASLITDDFSIEDETINFGVGACVLPPEGPYATSKAAFIANLNIRMAEALVTDQSYTPLLVVHDCEHISVRWQGMATAKGNIPNT
jgi:hypothetical protein